MGVFITIRYKFGWVLMFVIAFAIVGFLLMDAISSNTNLFNKIDNKAGSVNGLEITNEAYQRKVNEVIDQYTLNTGNSNVPEETMNALRNQAWDEYIKEVIMSAEYDELGISVTKQELYELLQGNNPHPVVVQQFTDPNTGQFSPQQIANFIRNLDVDDENMTSAEKKQRWKGFETFIKQDRLTNKYNNLVKQSIYATTTEAKEVFQLNNTQVDISYVLYNYSTVPDNQISYTDADLKAYLEAHPGRFEQERSRIIDYVTFEVIPSPQDTAEALSDIEELKQQFIAANSDSVFLKLYSDEPYDPAYYTQDKLASSIADTFFTVDSGTVVGPYLEGNSFVLAKLLGRKGIADSVKARQIVFRPTSQEDVVLKKAQADSLKLALESGEASFEQLVLQYSDDESSIDGDMGWVKPGELFPTINRGLFYDYNEGDYFVVGSDQAFHLIQITEADQNQEGAKVAFVKREIRPSKSTSNNKFNEANQFLGEYGTAEKFKTADVNVRTSAPLMISTNEIAGLGTARDIVKWSFMANEGQVSNVFILEDKFVVAMLKDAREEGMPSVEDVRGELENLVKQEKKTAFVKAKISGKTDLNAIASTLGVEVKSATGVSFNSTSIGGSNEPRVAGASVALNEGEVSEPIQGNLGVYVVKATSVSKAQEPAGYSMQKQQLSQTNKFRVDNQLYNAIKEASNVQDERYKFY